MEKCMEPAQISTDWHREDIIAAVRKKKKSLSALSREYGLSPGTLGNALTRPWPRGEEIIASIIGLPPEEIWPSRYKSKKSVFAEGKTSVQVRPLFEV